MGVTTTTPFKTVGGGAIGSTTTWQDPTLGYYTLTNNDLTILKSSGAGWNSAFGTTSVSSGKYYWETIIDQVQSPDYIINGIATSSATWGTYAGGDAYGYGYYGWNGDIYNSAAVAQSTGILYSTNNIISMLLNLDDDFLTFWKDGAQIGIPQAIVHDAYFPAVSLHVIGSQVSTNFGASSFVYTPPAGYTALP